MSETRTDSPGDLARPASGDAERADFTAARTTRGPYWPFLLKLIVSAALIAVILWRAEIDIILATLAGADLRWAALGLVWQFVAAGIIALRWQGLLAARGVASGWRYLYASTIISNFFRQFLPSILGGDVIRAYDAWRAGATPGLAFMSLLLDRLFGLLALALLAAAVLLSFREATAALPSSEVYIAGAVCALAAVALLILQLVLPSRRLLRLAGAVATRAPARVRPGLEKIGAALATYRNARGVVARALVLSLILQANVITFYWMLAMALDLGVDYSVFYIVVPIAFVVMLLPITVNGIGLREGIFVFLLAPWGVDASAAVAFAWLEYAVTLIFGLLAGIVYMLRTR